MASTATLENAALVHQLTCAAHRAAPKMKFVTMGSARRYARSTAELMEIAARTMRPVAMGSVVLVHTDAATEKHTAARDVL